MQMLRRFHAAQLVCLLLLANCVARGGAQRPVVPEDTPATAPHRTRLILKDGSFQVVMSYRVKGNRVLIVSAERGGAEEEIPVALVDFDATRRWEKQHTPSSADEQGQAPVPAIDPELLKEEEARRALAPEVAPDLRLPEQESVLALDIFRGTEELVPLSQSAGDLNTTTSHNILKSAINPMASSHQIVQLKGETANAQLHVNQPALYLRANDESGIRAGGTPLTVDTHGASTASINQIHGHNDSQYVIVRVDVRQGARVVASFQVNRSGEVKQQEDVVETASETLPGGQWVKLTPRSPLSFGEYALVEVLSAREVNLGVWDFGVHPTAPENKDALKPEPKRPVSLERRGPQH